MLKKSMSIIMALSSLVVVSACSSNSNLDSDLVNKDKLGSCVLPGVCAEFKLSSDQSSKPKTASKIRTKVKSDCQNNRGVYSSNPCSQAGMIGSCMLPEKSKYGCLVQSTLVFSSSYSPVDAEIECNVLDSSFIAAP